MNIFILDRDPSLAAEYHCDKHVVKMIVESAQIMSTALQQLYGIDERLYKPTHVKHPCVIWAMESQQNIVWLWRLSFWLCMEYTRRYEKNHKSRGVLEVIAPRLTELPNNGLTPFPQVVPPDCVSYDSVEAYRKYYAEYKFEFATWTKRKVPDWYEKRRRLLESEKG